MNKKILCLFAAVMMLLMAGASLAAAKPKLIEVPVPWQVFDLGPAEQYITAFDTSTIKYDRNSDGSINKNIIIYDERKINDIPMSTEYRFYSITKCRLNVENQSICFGDESFYTKKDKFRWTDTPAYLTWITVRPDTIGAIKYVTLVEYAKAHDDELTARS